MDMIQIMMLTDPFHHLPVTALHQMHLRKDEAAFLQDDPSRGLFYVQSGCVTLIRHTDAGHPVILHRASPGESFAEASLFSSRYHCDCIATKDASLLRLDKLVVLSCLQTNSEFAIGLLRHFAGQVQGYRRHLEILAIKSAEDRVLAALSDRGQEGTIMAFAARIGLSHEAAYRALTSLTKRDLVRRTARGLYEVIRKT